METYYGNMERLWKYKLFIFPYLIISISDDLLFMEIWKYKITPFYMTKSGYYSNPNYKQKKHFLPTCLH